MQNQPNMSMGSTGMNSSSNGALWQKIINRAKLVLTDPKGCWSTIQSEPSDLKSIYMNWIVPVAGTVAVCQFLGSQLWGYSALGMTIRPGFGDALVSGIMMFVMTCAGLFIMSHVLAFLAPKFGGRSDSLSTLKLLAYASTAQMVGGMLLLLPLPIMALSLIGLILGIYSLYTFWCGIEPMTGVPAASKIVYSVVSIVSYIIVMVILGMLTGGGMAASNMNTMSNNGEKIELPDGVTIDPEEMRKATEQMQKMFPQQGN